ncbi:MAG: DMT family transporter [Proteobacteria bacterium]|nr:DMT family transporter [Pseudomonadota bacterium]
MRPTLATLVGGSAILMWGGLAALTATAGAVPPLLLTALTFAIGTVVLLLASALRGVRLLALARQPLRVWLLGIGGLFGYHVLYFTALQNAPTVEASLIAFLWPLLIVLLSGLLPGERVRWFHILGGIAGFAGSAMLMTGGRFDGFRSEYALGYAAALGCALTWSGYSVLSRRLGQVPSDIVGLFCGATAVLALIAHGVTGEATRWPEGAQWLAVIGLGIGPVGLAFVTWDIGVKRGDIRLLGVASYGAPLISTLLLIALAMAPGSSTVLAACALIVGGAVIASGDSLRRRKG